MIGQTDGTLLRANPAGFSSPGLPATSIRIGELSEDDQLRVLAGSADALTAHEVHFFHANALRGSLAGYALTVAVAGG